jgi:hypothetical protein
VHCSTRSRAAPGFDITPHPQENSAYGGRGNSGWPASGAWTRVGVLPRARVMCRYQSM